MNKHTTEKAIICGNWPRVTATLKKLDISVLEVGESNLLDYPLSGHADLLCARTPGGCVYTYSAELSARLKKLNIPCQTPTKPLGRKYPFDVPLNCAYIGKYFLCNTKHCDPELILEAEKNGFEVLHTNQGYAKCSTAIVGASAVITSDSSIEKALRGKRVDVLSIRPGYIALPCYDYGFIGGCCGMIDENRLLFCGDPAQHPDGKSISDFVFSHGVQIVKTDNMPLFDFGGLVTL